MKKSLFFRKGMKILFLGIMSFSAVILLLFVGCSKKDNVKPDQPDQLKSSFSYSQAWHSGGSASISVGSSGYTAQWSNVSDAVIGAGWNPGSARTVTYKVSSVSGYHCVGIYGWTTSPLIEYYITEFGSNGGTKVNTITSDGHTYTFYKQQRVNAPSIQGTKTFWQYKDSWGGSSTGSNHTITTGNHINNWKSKGGQGFGSYNYMIFSVEAMNQSGSINVSTLN